MNRRRFLQSACALAVTASIGTKAARAQSQRLRFADMHTHIGMYRDPKTLEPVEYFYKVPADLSDRDVIVCDPMLATGNSAVAAVTRIKQSKPGPMRFVCLLACPEGLATFHAAHPDVPVFTGAVDERLNDHGYIVPGLGDAGDRLFGTK